MIACLLSLIAGYNLNRLVRYLRWEWSEHKFREHRRRAHKFACIQSNMRIAKLNEGARA